MKFDIVSFGSAVVDTFVNTEIKDKNNSFNYPVGAKILIKDLKFDIGGGGTNTAVAFARLGLKTGCICKIGDDNNGKDILNLLQKEKITFLGNISNEKTGYSVILDSTYKDRTILTFKGPNNKILLKDIKKFESKWLYFSALLGQSFETQKKLAEILTKKGTKLAFNPSSYLIKHKNLTSLLKLTNILILNKQEAEMICKNKKSDLLVSLYELGPRIVVITDKDKKIECYDGIKKYFIIPHKNVKVVERTGAGDAFASGFVAGQIAGFDIQKSLELGLEESENVIRHFGAKNNLIKRKLK
ncbi:MAG: carbohydrate kinase family protein [Candidatus Pacearchaeota archaeon]